jgi:nitrate/TMAO reductase-like tetraheme cytochrome c subunit
MHRIEKRPGWFLLTQHWVSLAGVALFATAVISWLFVLPMEVRGRAGNPYVGIIAFLVLPFIFFVGLALIPIGIYLGKHRVRKGLESPELDRKTALRRLAWVFGVTTLFNFLVGTQLTYRAVTYMETPNFCGTSCHTMAPQFAAYQNSPHSRVDCVDCHVAPGAAGWVNSKAAGTRQLIETAFNTYQSPIPSALESNRLVPSRQTCENCHWPQKFGGVTLRVINKYAEDETNSRTQSVLLMMVGGGKVAGIHDAHLGPGINIRFAVADPARQTIPWVEYRNSTIGVSKTFAVPDTKQPPETLPKHDMQCVDCHNRPTHTFELPERAIDKAMERGEIPVTLPFIKKKGVEVLKINYNTREEASEKIPQSLVSFYRQNYSELYAKRSHDIDQAAQAIVTIYKRNVFPDLKVSWGTYPNNLGHMDTPGCFRCHDGSHAAADGKAITQDCSTCHELLATDEASPQILKTLGIAERISNLQKK